jgi:hypothetical protein
MRPAPRWPQPIPGPGPLQGASGAMFAKRFRNHSAASRAARAIERRLR